MPLLRRGRGVLLRISRQRRVSMVLGLVLAAPAAWVEFSGQDAAWWLQGLALVVGATGLALFWTGVAGARPDWQE